MPVYIQVRAFHLPLLSVSAFVDFFDSVKFALSCHSHKIKFSSLAHHVFLTVLRFPSKQFVTVFEVFAVLFLLHQQQPLSPLLFRHFFFEQQTGKSVFVEAAKLYSVAHGMSAPAFLLLSGTVLLVSCAFE